MTRPDCGMGAAPIRLADLSPDERAVLLAIYTAAWGDAHRLTPRSVWRGIRDECPALAVADVERIFGRLKRRGIIRRYQRWEVLSPWDAGWRVTPLARPLVDELRAAREVRP